MPAATVNEHGSIAGLSIQSKIERTATGHIGQEADCPAAKTGSLTARTDNDTGEVTLSAGHGIQTGDKVDVYWTGGIRYGMDATVDGNAVTVDAGAGDNLPAEDTSVTLAKQVTIDIDFVGNLVQLVMAGSDKRAHVEFREAAASAKGVELPAAEGWRWAKNQGIANPLADKTIASVKASCGDAIVGTKVQVGVLYDSVS